VGAEVNTARTLHNPLLIIFNEKTEELRAKDIERIGLR
jgi:hypothetical protein